MAKTPIWPDDTVAAMAKGIVWGPDGQDWLDALRAAPDRLDDIDDEGWALVPKREVRLLLAAFSHALRHPALPCELVVESRVLR